MKPLLPREPAKLRQQLLDSERSRAEHLEILLQERGPIIRGTYVVQPGRCGKPTCKCARGEFHTAAALYTREERQQRCLYVPLADRDRVEVHNRRYRRARKARAALAKLGNHTLALADAFIESLIEPYPPEGSSQPKARSRRRARRGKEPAP